MSIKGQTIVLPPAKTDSNFTLDKMLEGVTPQNVHGEIEWGPDVGSEVINDK